MFRRNNFIFKGYQRRRWIKICNGWWKWKKSLGTSFIPRNGTSL